MPAKKTSKKAAPSKTTAPAKKKLATKSAPTVGKKASPRTRAVANRPRIDPARARPPGLDVPGAVSLGIRLLNGIPDGAPRDVIDAASDLRTSVVGLQSAWRAAAASSPALVRPTDIVHDTAWSGLLGRLEQWLSITTTQSEKAARAQALIDTFFEKRLDFTRLDAPEQWAQSQQRITLFPKYRADLDALAGPEFVDAVIDGHARMGRLLGLDGAKVERSQKTDLRAPLRSALDAIGDYLLALVSADRTVDDATSEAIHAELDYVDSRRAVRAGDSTAPTDAAATPTTPVPEVAAKPAS